MAVLAVCVVLVATAVFTRHPLAVTAVAIGLCLLLWFVLKIRSAVRMMPTVQCTGTSLRVVVRVRAITNVTLTINERYVLTLSVLGIGENTLNLDQFHDADGICPAAGDTIQNVQILGRIGNRELDTTVRFAGPGEVWHSTQSIRL